MNLFRSLPINLLVLLYALPGIVAQSTSSYDPFHGIAKFVPKPPEQPICCLKPLPSSESTEELVISFEDWKARQAQMQADEKPRESAKPAPTPVVSSDPSPDSTSDEQPASTAIPTEQPASPHFRVPLTGRFNYASLDCSARVHSAHRSAKSPSSILSSKKDRYMLSPCETPGEEKSIVVELCDDIWIDTVQLANFEFFSGVFKDFSVSVSRTNADSQDWTPAGTFRAKNIRGVQSFHPPALRDFYRFIKIDFHSHYGNEYYCPLSLLRVYGLTHLEQWKWDQWESGSHNKKGDLEEALSISAQISSESVIETTSMLNASKPLESFSSIEVSTSEVNKSQEVSNVTSTESQSTSVTPHQTEAYTDETPCPIHVSVKVAGASSDSAKESSMTQILNQSSSSTATSSQETTIIGSSATSDEPVVVSSSESSASSSLISSSASTTSTSKVISSPIPTVVPLVHSNVPAAPSAGESIYRTIMTRLGLLESNATLHLRYVEEQTRTMRDALRRLEEDVGRVEGIGKAQAQHFLRITQEWEKQRKRLEREHGELLSKVDFLSEEIVLEKRLGIAQLCLLLTVLVFMALTRGSRGEAIVDPHLGGGRRHALREWGRRHLSSLSSGDWKFGGTGSPTPTVSDEKARIPEQVAGVLFPSVRDLLDERLSNSDTTTQLDKPFSMSEDARASPSKTPIASSSKRQTPLTDNNPLVLHAPHPTYAGHPISLNNTPHRPRLRRSSSHHTPPTGITASYSSGALPTSARKWARTAHLHEIRRGIRRPQSPTTLGVNSVQSTPGYFHTRHDENGDDYEEDAERASLSSLENKSRVKGKERQKHNTNFFGSEVVKDLGEGRTSLDNAREPLSPSTVQNVDFVLQSQSSPKATNISQRNTDRTILEVETESDSWLDTDTDVEVSELGDSDGSKAGNRVT